MASSGDDGPDAERGGGISLASSVDATRQRWTTGELLTTSVGQWEPTYDLQRWREHGVLSLFVQRVGQGDGERLEDMAPQMVSIVDWRP